MQKIVLIFLIIFVLVASSRPTSGDSVQDLLEQVKNIKVKFNAEELQDSQPDLSEIARSIQENAKNTQKEILANFDAAARSVQTA